jgi:hypothetical protein
VRLGEGRHQRPIDEVGEKDRLCYGIGRQTNASVWRKDPFSKAFLPRRGVSLCGRFHALMNNPG